ncbi:MAG: sulfotransferase [Rhodobiaceae bacterium]|nr:sulfotransferase [Rhodobiaceae bacterium]
MTKNRVCIITTQRSGSTWLMQSLNKLDFLRCYGEVFLPEHTDTFQGDPRLRPPMFYGQFCESRGKARAIGGFLDMLEGSSDKPVIFKIMYDQIRRHPEIIPALIMRRYRIIHLVRRDTVRLLTSRLLARTTKVYHSTSEVEQPVLRPEPTEFRRSLEHIDRLTGRADFLLKLLPLRCMTIDYETMASDPDAMMARLGEFVGIDGFRYVRDTKGWVKTNKRTLSQNYENFAELRSAVAGTPFESQMVD